MTDAWQITTQAAEYGVNDGEAPVNGIRATALTLRTGGSEDAQDCKAYRGGLRRFSRGGGTEDAIDGDSRA